MKLCTFTHQGINGFGVIENDQVIDLTPVLKKEGVSGLLGVIESDLLGACEDLAQSSNNRYSIADIQFEPVIPNPGKIICVGVNYEAHKIETGRPDYVHPTLFTRYPESQIGHLQPMLRPPETDQLDFEGELAVIIGKPGRRIAQEDALSHIVGYSCYNDGSVRDWQKHTAQFLPGKSFVGTGAFGPWMVTADEITDPTQLDLSTRLNGEVVQSSSTDLMINSIPVLIEYISTIFPLNPGDVIVTGTPGGVGARRTPPLFMHDGDVVEVEISQIGVLRNTVREE